MASADAGDTQSGTGHGESDHTEVPHVVRLFYPENIQKRLDALKHILEQDMHTNLFLLEAKQHKKMALLFEERADIISGTQEPSAAEAVFQLKDAIPDLETTPADDRKGIPNFWSTVLLNHNHTVDLIEEHDHGVLEFLADIRTVYQEKPLGFSLEFEFKENPWFTNKVLTRSYEFEDGGAVAKEDLYMSTGLQPKSSKGTVIDWKEGKNLLKGEMITFQLNNNTGEFRQMKTPIEQDSFFTFFAPSVTDLQGLMKTPLTEADEEHAADHMQKIQDAEMEYELASAFRTRIIPRALLIFTEDMEKVAITGQSEIIQEMHAETAAQVDMLNAVISDVLEVHEKAKQEFATEARTLGEVFLNSIKGIWEKTGHANAVFLETYHRNAVNLMECVAEDGEDSGSLEDALEFLREHYDAFCGLAESMLALPGALFREQPPSRGQGLVEDGPPVIVEPDSENGAGRGG